jgi:pimeloyl-ACP methyl ester carboxylesterase
MRSVWTACCLLLLSFSADRLAAQPQEYPAYTAADRLPLEVCRIDGIAEPLLCGSLEVYENRAYGTGRKIPISVVVIPAKEERLTDSAWTDHQGGPRYSMIAQARYFAEGGFLESFRRNRDIVLVDPRGLHESNPLYCDALKYPRILEQYYPPKEVAACRAELDKKADLSQYSTINAVDDLEDIREWLGYRQWDVGGWSYGSRFMLTYLHRYPSSIRTISLSFPSILNFQRPLDYARFGQQAFDGLVADCAEDDPCAAAFPDPSGDLSAILATLESEPVTVEILNPYTSAKEKRVVTRDIFAESIWIAILKNRTARQVPFVLRRAAEGDLEPFLELTVPTEPPTAEPEGHYFSVVCPEETGQIDMAKAEAASEGTFVGSYIAEDYIGACDAWGMPLSPKHPVEARVFDVPAIIFTGDRDPVTQPEYGEVIAQHFTNVRHIVLPRVAHGSGGLENAGCYDTILSTFVENASVDDLDTSCIGTMRPPPFRLK